MDKMLLGEDETIRTQTRTTRNYYKDGKLTHFDFYELVCCIILLPQNF